MEPLQLPLGIPQVDLAERFQQVQQTNPDLQQQAASKEMKRLEEERREAVQETHLVEEAHPDPERREEKGSAGEKEEGEEETSREGDEDASIDIHV